MTDLVITYVNSEDEKWREQYAQYADISRKSSSRFRDWGFLPIIVENTERLLPWIRKIYIVVQSESQIPSGIKSNKVEYIFHEDIIPEEFLPTFNYTTIDMFLYRIKGLSEEFIYSNDDIIPVRQLSHDEFYKDGIPKLKYKVPPLSKSLGCYEHNMANSEKVVRSILNLPENKITYFDFYHSWNPMLRSTWEYLHEACGEQIIKRITRFRSPQNANQYLCPIYHLLTGKYLYSSRKTLYCSFPLKKKDFKDNIQIVCLNDDGVVDFEKEKDDACAMLRGIKQRIKYN